MLKDIVAVEALDTRHLRVRFEDGVEGTVDVPKLVKLEGVFAPLRDPKVFVQVRVDPDLGTIYWPCGADLDPDVLYAKVAGTPLPGQPERAA